MISNKQRGSLAKLPGLTGMRPGQTALGRWIAIIRSRAKGYAGSNLGRVSRIGRPGLVGRPGSTMSTSYPAAALGELRRTWLNPMLRGPIRPEFWSGVVYATCVTLLGQQRGSAGVGAWCAAAEAALRWRIVTPGFKDKTECIAICMPGSSFIHIETS